MPRFCPGSGAAGRSCAARVRLQSAIEIGFALTPLDFYAAIEKQFGIPYEGDVLTRILRNGELKSDQLHPNAKGYLLMAERVADLLRKSGAL